MCKVNYRDEIQRVLAEQMNQEATTLEEASRARYALACSHLESGNNKAGYKCLKEIIETLLHVFGEDHALKSHVSASAVLSLAATATQLGHREEAFGWLNCVDREVQNGAFERSLVDIGLVQSFAGLYSSLGQCDRALPYAERSVQMYERDETVGETPNKLKAKHMVASIYSDLGQLDKAVTISKEICKEAKKKLGSSHPTTKLAKLRHAQLEDHWAGVDPSSVQAQMTASKGRRVTIGFLNGIVNRKDLDSTPVEIRLFSREKRQYLVQVAGGNRSQFYVKPSNIIFDMDTHVHVHGLQNASKYNGKEGMAREYSNKAGRYTVELRETHKLITVKPENLLVKFQPDFVFDTTRTLAQMLSHPNACY
jgi:tetratricopeptide (TPR) repeat protein